MHWYSAFWSKKKLVEGSGLELVETTLGAKPHSMGLHAAKRVVVPLAKQSILK
jgi:hypothetical protein